MTYYIKLENKLLKVPEEAEYIAQDFNGKWYFYTHKPCYHIIKKHWIGCSLVSNFIVITSSPKHPGEELYRIDRVERYWT